MQVYRAIKYIRLSYSDDKSTESDSVANQRKLIDNYIAQHPEIIQRLYEDSVLGKLSDTRFSKMSAQYETEQAEIQQLVAALEREIEDEAGQVADVGRFLQLAEKYSDLQELDAATVNELIDKIVIHNPERINGKKHVTIEVHFTYVGKIRIPLQRPAPLLRTEKPA